MNQKNTKKKSNQHWYPHVLAICGGGLKGLCYVGALYSFEQYGISLEKIPVLAGSSIGSIICTSLCLGYKISEIKKELMEVNPKKIFPRMFGSSEQKVIPLLINQFSLHDGIEMDKYLQSLFTKKGYDFKTLTFRKLRKQCGKKLIITGSNVTTGKGEYYSSRITPHMLVYDAVRISSRVPWLLPVIRKENHILVDGDLLGGFPLQGCKKKDQKRAEKGDMIGLQIEDPESTDPITNIIDCFTKLLRSLLKKYFQSLTHKYKNNLLVFPIRPTNGMILSKQEMNEMYQLGVQMGKTYIQHKLLTIPYQNYELHKMSSKDLDLHDKEEHHPIKERLDMAFVMDQEKCIDQ